MNRRKLRDYTFKCIFHASFYNREDLPGQMELFLQDTDIPEDANEPDEADTADGRTAVPEAKTAAPAPAPLTEKEQQAVLQRAEDVLSHLDEIDRMITEKTEGWSPGTSGVFLTRIKDRGMVAGAHESGRSFHHPPCSV